MIRDLALKRSEQPSFSTGGSRVTSMNQCQSSSLKKSTLVCCAMPINGENKEGQHLSFDAAKINSMKYHYASCYYDSGVYLKMYPPGEQNSDEEGNPVDVLGSKIKYSCKVSGGSIRRQMGYKAYSVHMAHEHGGVLKVMANSDNEAGQEVGRRFQKIVK